MPEPDWTAIFAALGPVGGALFGLVLLLKYTGFVKTDEPQRSDVLTELKSFRRENAEESRAIKTEIDALRREVIDVKARTQENIAEHGRRLDRMERR